MTTVVNNPGNGNNNDDSTGVGIVVAVIILVVAAGLFFVYGLPMIRQAATPQGGSIDVNLKLPPPAAPAPQPTTQP